MLPIVWEPTSANSFVWWGVEGHRSANVGRGTGSPTMEPPASQMKVRRMCAQCENVVDTSWEVLV